MTAADLMSRLGRDIVSAGAARLPSVLLVREAPLYEVEFAALAFTEKTKLRTSDWAVLALARAREEVTPRAIEGYLGLDERVAEALLQGLLKDGLVAEITAQSSEEAAPEAPPESLLAGFFARLLRRRAVAPPPRTSTPAETRARYVREPRGRGLPRCRLTAAGAEALDVGALVDHRIRTVRALFLADPLLYVETIDERQHRFTQHRRPRVLEPDEVPESLRTLDEAIAREPAAIGIREAGLGAGGTLVGVVPDTEWEVRAVTRRRRVRGRDEEPGNDVQTATVALAGVVSSERPAELEWTTYLARHNRLVALGHVKPASLSSVPGLNVMSMAALLQSVEGIVPRTMREDGALEVRCSPARLPGLLGEADRPEDAYLTDDVGRWTLGVRVHAVPSDGAAAQAAFYVLLGRHQAALRREFDSTCGAVAAALRAYWGERHELPTGDEAAHHLWASPEFRAAVCMRRLDADLVTAYRTRGLP